MLGAGLFDVLGATTGLILGLCGLALLLSEQCSEI